MTDVLLARFRVALPVLVVTASVALLAMVVAAPAARAHGGAAQHGAADHPGDDNAASPADDLKLLFGGDTTLILDPGAVQALAGVPVEAIGAAYDVPGGFAFPITVGIVDGRGGRIAHRGGLRFGEGKSALRLTRFVIDLDHGKLTARVNGDGRVPILDLTVLGQTPPDSFASAVGRLTPEAAGALGKPALAGAVLGVATIRPDQID